MKTLKLGDLLQVVEQDSRERRAWPRVPEQAALGYAYAYGKVLAELESRWQWDRKRERGRYYRGKVMRELSYLLRNYLLLRLAGPLRTVGGDIAVFDVTMREPTQVMTCLVNLGEMSAMLNRPSLFLHYIYSICRQLEISYEKVVLSLSLTKEGEE